MDPNECLFEIRKLAAECASGKISTVDTNRGINITYGVALAEQVQALDEWITKGGFLPREWAPGGAL